METLSDRPGRALILRPGLAEDGEQPEQVVEVAVQVTHNDQAASERLEALLSSHTQPSTNNEKQTRFAIEKRKAPRLNHCFLIF